jgi:hypothetical protein
MKLHGSSHLSTASPMAALLSHLIQKAAGAA